MIPPQDYDLLYDAGVKGIYGPGTPIPACAEGRARADPRSAVAAHERACQRDVAPTAPLPAPTERLLEGDRGGRAEARRRALAKAITLLESTRADHQAPRRRDARRRSCRAPAGALRIGISGSPGVGKSTFIEALGLHLIGAGHRVAVLAVDPSLDVSGGSILGDKTRMERLSVDERAFIRPSPAAGRSAASPRIRARRCCSSRPPASTS